jgi:hypothetical protein
VFVIIQFAGQTHAMYCDVYKVTVCSAVGCVSCVGMACYFRRSACAVTQGAVRLLRRRALDRIPVKTLGIVYFGEVLC